MRMEIDKENIPVDSHPQVHGVKGRETLNRLLLQTRTGSSAFSRGTFLLCTFLTFLTGACSRCKLSSHANHIAHAMYLNCSHSLFPDWLEGCAFSNSMPRASCL